MTRHEFAAAMDDAGKPLTPERMRAWLDRPPPPFGFAQLGPAPRSWRDWFGWPHGDGDYAMSTYLGQRSARVGPDDVGAAQRCGCEQCAKSATIQAETEST